MLAVQQSYFCENIFESLLFAHSNNLMNVDYRKNMRKSTRNYSSTKLSYKSDSKPTEASLKEEKLINAIKLLHQNDTEYKGKYTIPAIMHLGLQLF